MASRPERLHRALRRRLRGPVLNGSGTFDAIAARRAFGDALLERFPFDAFVSKTITLEPRQGNPPPRLWETPAGLINSIGLPNKGLDGFLESDLPQLAELPVPLIVSVMGFSRDELARLVAAVGARDEVAMLELNVSCPNVETGLVMGADPAETAAAVERVRSESQKPLIVKLTPNAADPGGRGPRRRGGGCGRRLAREHAQGHGAPPGDPRAVARRPHRRGVRSGDPRDRPRAGGERLGEGRDPRYRHGRHLDRPSGGRFPRRGRHRHRDRHRELPRPRRRPADRRRARRHLPYRGHTPPQPRRSSEPVWGTREGCFSADCGNFLVRSAHRSNLLNQNPCKQPEKRSRTPNRPQAKVEVKVN